jgi:hypothetical protein
LQISTISSLLGLDEVEATSFSRGSGLEKRAGLLTKQLSIRQNESISEACPFFSWHHRGRVAGLYRYNPAPSEPDVRLATHPAQASHKLQIVPECIC